MGLRVVTSLLVLATFASAQTQPTTPKPQTKSTKPGATSGAAATPMWLKKELATEKVALAGHCRYPDGYTAMNVGKGRGTSDAHCANNCTHGPMKIDPSPVVGNINQDLGVNFRLDQVLGGPNAVCASSGTVDWGDGTSSPMPSDTWKDCDGRPSGILGSTVTPTGGVPPNYTIHHTYRTAGEYCVSAKVWGNHKYDGDGS